MALDAREKGNVSVWNRLLLQANSYPFTPHPLRPESLNWKCENLLPTSLIRGSCKCLLASRRRLMLQQVIAVGRWWKACVCLTSASFLSAFSLWKMELTSGAKRMRRADSGTWVMATELSEGKGGKSCPSNVCCVWESSVSAPVLPSLYHPSDDQQTSSPSPAILFPPFFLPSSRPFQPPHLLYPLLTQCLFISCSILLCAPASTSACHDTYTTAPVSSSLFSLRSHSEVHCFVAQEAQHDSQHSSCRWLHVTRLFLWFFFFRLSFPFPFIGFPSIRICQRVPSIVGMRIN